ncbi:hypothetical protein TeGR_g9932 [Tetraparma gracilis]|uniref:Battenin n=1 Tax=Tetraparma gracilis TaxID=2962635 RepID=A0ABQ6M5I6_9STRA|nr:hypothetical protein TeGR_g9932 [Tetraparma gracilis]
MAPPSPRRLLLCFFLLGLLNNAAYTIMLASAKQISEGGVGLVFAANVLPSLLVKLSSPLWFAAVGYTPRLLLCCALLLVGFQLVALSADYRLQLAGVCFCSAQSGLGEASFLALTALHRPFTARALTAWSSGTGAAGVFGFFWVWLFMDTLGLSLRGSMLLGNLLVLAFAGVYFALPPPPGEQAGRGRASSDEEGLRAAPADSDEEGAGGGADEVELIVGKGGGGEDPVPEGRLRFVTGTLYKYMLPLFIVYFSEYAMQSGTWAAIGFPVEDEGARKKFYEYANWLYQAGVFVSRSSGTLVQANMLVLQLMPVLQTALLVLFTFIAVYQFLYGWGLLAVCFVVGLLGGGVYVNAFTRISVDVEKGPRQEVALAIVSVADSFGILFADVAGLFLQACIYKHHGLDGAKMTCPF